MNFDINTEQLGDSSYVISLAGEVDLYTAPEFKERMSRVQAHIDKFAPTELELVVSCEGGAPVSR